MDKIEQAREVVRRLSIGSSIARDRRIDHDFAGLADAACIAMEMLIAELAALKGQEPVAWALPEITQQHNGQIVKHTAFHGYSVPLYLAAGAQPAKPLTEAAYRSEINGVSQIHPLAAKLPNGEVASNVYQAYDIGYEQGVKFRAGKHRAWIGPNGAFTQDKKRVEKWERKGFPFITLLSDARYDL